MKHFTNRIIGISIFIITFFPTNTIFSQDQSQNEKNLTQEEIVRVNNDRTLVADKIDVKLETAVIDSIRMIFELEEEDEEMSPADELYEGIWNNEFIKTYSNVTVPDSYRIDISSFNMPVEGKITSPFGQRKRRFHYGTDLKLYVGDTVYSAFEGKVRIKQYEKKGYGYYLVLRHPNGLETLYGHLSKFLVDEEETVAAGQPIGLGGNTGRSYGSHLHFEFRFLGNAIDPADIVDFNNFCTFDDFYVFEKSKVNSISINNNKFTATNRSVKYHRIEAGDTLAKIAKKYGVSVTQICRLNGLRPTSTLRIGRIVRYS